jgi:hypothetical protein
MKILVSPEFNTKVSALDANGIKGISNFISIVESLEANELLSSSALKIIALEGGIYYSELPSGRVFFTLGKDGEEDYLLLMDVTSIRSSANSRGNGFFAPNNPRTNSSLNPKYNSSINPKFNSSINPRFNSSINPKFNSSINPKFNSSINPKFNSSINMRFNTSINPRFNSSINPKMNSSLNPKLNRSYGGPYLYDLDLNQTAFLVKANSSVDLVFSPELDLQRFLVFANEKVKIEFDTDSSWVGYYVEANEKVWLRYSSESDWIGLLV